MAATITADRRIEKLSTASVNRIVDPDRDLPGAVGDGQLVPDDLLFAACGLDAEGEGVGSRLTAEQKVALGRAALAAIIEGGLFFESALLAGFALEITKAPDYTDPRITYLLHEMGEETRHSRLFARLLQQIGPTPMNPYHQGISGFAARIAVGRIIRMPAMLYTMVLAGEEIPDLFQKLAAEHPDTDDFVREVNRYHRQEEARHLAFARLRMPEVWARAGLIDRLAVRFVAPIVIREMYEMLVHPAVFAAAGLPRLRSWRRARRHPARAELLHRAVHPVIDALLAGKAFGPGRVPRAWRRLGRVDSAGRPGGRATAEAPPPPDPH
jgi:hypothetical protein